MRTEQGTQAAASLYSLDRRIRPNRHFLPPSFCLNGDDADEMMDDDFRLKGLHSHQRNQWRKVDHHANHLIT